MTTLAAFSRVDMAATRSRASALRSVAATTRTVPESSDAGELGPTPWAASAEGAAAPRSTMAPTTAAPRIRRTESTPSA